MSDEKNETDTPSTTEDDKEKELPPEVDAFLKGKNKYKHPYGDWKPVVKTELLKRKTFGDQLELPEDNWHLPENQAVPVISDVKDESHVKVVFKEKEIPAISATSATNGNETVTFKKRKTAANRQLRGSASDKQQKRNSDEL